MKLSVCAAAAAAFLVCSPAAFAQSGQSANDIDTSGDRITVAAGVASVPDYEGADSSEVTPAAVVMGTVSGHDFWTRGTQLYVDAIPDSGGVGTHFELGGIAGVRRNRATKVDNLQVRALGELDTAYELGGFVGIQRTGVITSDYDSLSARIAMVGDVSGTYGSYVITPQLSYSTPLSRATYVGLNLSADYVGKGYGETYYSVTPAQSTASGLRPYSIDSSGFKSMSVAFYGVQSLSGNLLKGFGIGGGIVYSRLLGKYADSPLVHDVGSADQWIVGGGLTYTF
ncbi:MipA/OmpV family protein [Stakelama sediminis]|uniref:Outer membrane scaffolding protein for murein synthesis (MipA/OmpV family) n=1 Tax=Stakelama sediminis TaxID=463200 RepID=A0A840Z0D8_9SPHN|nr:MipA/OmpV family protein [Stakelama sediminis]MBB5719249.1 outer membrane scaffolding protein for murein synthesis (MipA/OmpV family) [Stakelama sediminis]